MARFIARELSFIRYDSLRKLDEILIVIVTLDMDRGRVESVPSKSVRLAGWKLFANDCEPFYFTLELAVNRFRRPPTGSLTNPAC